MGQKRKPPVSVAALTGVPKGALIKNPNKIIAAYPTQVNAFLNIGPAGGAF